MTDIKRQLGGNRTKILRFSMLSAVCVGCFLCVELLVRYLGSYDADGNFFVGNRMLRPYQLPVCATQVKIDEYVKSDVQSKLMFDASLGWSPRPNSTSRDGLEKYNSLGIRSAPTEYALSPADGVLRIALFGDSFTHGDEVPFEETWGHYLEEYLTQSGIDAEVINFGVGGYGMGQAFLRWKAAGRQLHPRVVIFGLQMENVKRNVNLIRPIYYPHTSIPFSKPRFVLHDGGLELINVPTIPADELPDLMSRIEGWPLAKHEYFLGWVNYRKPLWLRSKVLALSQALLSGNSSESFAYEAEFPYEPAEAPGKLTQAIIEAFEADVTSVQSQFVVVHLPREEDLVEIASGGDVVYAKLLDKIEEKHVVVHPEYEMLQAAKNSGLGQLFRRIHYSRAGNKLVAAVVAQHIVQCQSSSERVPRRGTWTTVE